MAMTGQRFGLKKLAYKESVMRISASQYRKHSESSMDLERLRGWTPIRAEKLEGHRRIHWANFKDTPFSDPFFFQTIDRYLAQDSYEIVMTGFEALRALRGISPGLEPCGFIFHISHCGSTAVNNVLGAIRRNISLSEPTALNEILFDRNASFEQRVEWFRGMVSAYGQRRLGAERNFIVKFNSWAILFFPFIRAAFPGTPWICLYRHPVEVLTGQFKRKVISTHWFGREFLDVEREKKMNIGLAEAAARIMGRYYELILKMAMSGPDGLCVNFNRLSEQTYSKILEHFKIKVSSSEFKQMCGTAKVYSKDPEKKTLFEDDSEKKRKEAYAIVREMSERWAMKPYLELETLLNT